MRLDANNRVGALPFTLTERLAFLERLRPALVRAALKAGAPSAEAEDAAQEAIIAVLRSETVAKLPRIELRAYALRAARNFAHTLGRAALRRSEREARWAEEPVERSLDPERALLHKSAFLVLVTAIVEIRDELRTPFLLHYAAGFTAAEIANCLGLPEGTVRSRTRRAIGLFAPTAHDEAERVEAQIAALNAALFQMRHIDLRGISPQLPAA